MLLQVGIFLFLLLLPGEGSLLPEGGFFGKKDSSLTPQLVKVKTVVHPFSRYEEKIMERRLGLIVFELEHDPTRMLTDYLVSSLSKSSRFRLLHLQRLSFPPSPLTVKAETTTPFPIEKIPLIESPPEVVSLPGMASRIGADLAIMGRVVVGENKEEGLKIHLRLVDFLRERILLAEVLQGDKNEILREMNAFIQEIYNRFPLLEGEVVFVRGNRINVNLGKVDGVKEGMEVIIYRVMGLERVPDRGWILGIETQDVGRAKISRVSEVSSEADVLELLPLCQIQRGDKVISR